MSNAQPAPSLRAFTYPTNQSNYISISPLVHNKSEYLPNNARSNYHSYLQTNIPYNPVIVSEPSESNSETRQQLQ